MELFEVIQKMIFLDIAPRAPEYIISVPMEPITQAFPEETQSFPIAQRQVVLVYEYMGPLKMGGNVRYAYRFKGARLL